MSWWSFSMHGGRSAIFPDMNLRHEMTNANCRIFDGFPRYVFGALYTRGDGRSSLPSARGLSHEVFPVRLFL